MPHSTQYRSFRRQSSQPITWLILTNKTVQENADKQTQYKSEKVDNLKYSTTKLTWFSCLLQHSARKRGGLILHCPWAHTGRNGTFMLSYVVFKDLNFGITSIGMQCICTIMATATSWNHCKDSFTNVKWQLKSNIFKQEQKYICIYLHKWSRNKWMDSYKVAELSSEQIHHLTN